MLLDQGWTYFLNCVTSSLMKKLVILRQNLVWESLQVLIEDYAIIIWVHSDSKIIWRLKIKSVLDEQQ